MSTYKSYRSAKHRRRERLIRWKTYAQSLPNLEIPKSVEKVSGGHITQGVGYFFAAVAIHSGGVLGLNTMDVQPHKKPERAVVSIAVVQTEPKKPDVLKPIGDPLAKDDVKSAEAPKKIEKPPKPKPKRKLKSKRKRKQKAKSSPKPKIVTNPKPQSNQDSKNPPKKVRPVVGISLQSTVQGGSGSSFAVGNTQFGQTADVAEDPKKVKRVAKGDIFEDETPSGNRRSTRKGVGGKLTKPKRRKKIEPEYPSIYKAQNIEGRVTVEIRLDKTGRVRRVKIISPSKHQKFNEEARKAAWKESFEPAKKGDRLIPYTLSFTYRFEIKTR